MEQASTKVLHPKIVYMKMMKAWITKHSHPVQFGSLLTHKRKLFSSDDPPEPVHIFTLWSHLYNNLAILICIIKSGYKLFANYNFGFSECSAKVVWLNVEPICLTQQDVKLFRSSQLSNSVLVSAVCCSNRLSAWCQPSLRAPPRREMPVTVTRPDGPNAGLPLWRLGHQLCTAA